MLSTASIVGLWLYIPWGLNPVDPVPHPPPQHLTSAPWIHSNDVIIASSSLITSHRASYSAQVGSSLRPCPHSPVGTPVLGRNWLNSFSHDCSSTWCELITCSIECGSSAPKMNIEGWQNHFKKNKYKHTHKNTFQFSTFNQHNSVGQTTHCPLVCGTTVIGIPFVCMSVWLRLILTLTLFHSDESICYGRAVGVDCCPEGLFQTKVGKYRPPTHQKANHLLFVCTVSNDDNESEIPLIFQLTRSLWVT